MIKQTHRPETKPANVVNFQKPATQTVAAVAGDVISGQESRYILKPVTTNGPLAVVMFAIAERLTVAEKAGYRYIDRIPASSTESIMIFEKVK